MANSTEPTAPSPAPRTTTFILRRIAVDAECDPRTVAKVLKGLPTKALPRARVLRALRALAQEPQP